MVIFAFRPLSLLMINLGNHSPKPCLNLPPAILLENARLLARNQLFRFTAVWLYKEAVWFCNRGRIAGSGAPLQVLLPRLDIDAVGEQAVVTEDDHLTPHTFPRGAAPGLSYMICLSH